LALEDIAKKLPAAGVEYNPKDFSGLVYHDKTTEINLLLFRSGIIIGYGTPFLDHFDELLTDLEQYYS
jgi:TATA-box binding protein (TBP) (component of TFIID and TFIIIB)